MYYENGQNYYQQDFSRQEPEEPVYVYQPQPEEPKKKPKRRGRIVALALACALLGGAVGAGISAAAARLGTATLLSSSRRVAQVQLLKVDGKTKMTMPEVYYANVNSTVSINVSATTTNIFGQRVESAASGSGFIITEDGYVVTNYHIVEDASNVKVTLYNGDTYGAVVIGGDEDYDVAVLKIDAKELAPVTLGDSAALQVGEDVAAIGNPLGELTFSMTSGIVSCVNRAINVSGSPFNMIQVDCSVNRGNSGGPLLNAYGEVVGIVSAKYSSYADTTVEGLGFAIPINDVAAIIDDVMINGRVTNKAYLGINGGTLTATMAKQYRYSINKGVFVYSVEEGGAAQKAGLRQGDVITKLNNAEVTSMETLNAAKKSYSAGDTVTLTVYRAGETLTVELTFDAAPANSEVAEEQDTTQDGGNSYGSNPYGGNPYGGYNPWDFFNNFFGNYYGR